MNYDYYFDAAFLLMGERGEDSTVSIDDADGTLKINFVVPGITVTQSEVEAKAAELAALKTREWAQLRTERDELLADTDWWASSDRTMTDEQTAYRQALRDLPANTSDPTNPTWPTKPS